MTTRQKKFCDEYILANGNGAEAARRAGYKARSANGTGAKLLANAEIRAEIDSRLEAARTAKTLEQSQLLEFLSMVVLGEVNDVQLMTRLTGKGCSVVERHEVRSPTKDRIKAAEILLKIGGAFDKTETKDSGAELLISTLEKICGDEGD